MKLRLVLILTSIALFATSGNLFAEECEEKPCCPENKTMLKKGSSALLFKVTGNLTIDEWQGMGIYMKHHFSPKRALRTGFEIDARLSDYGTDSNSGSSYYQDASTNVIDFAFSTQYIRFLSDPSDINFYWVAGPKFGVSYDIDREKRVYRESDLNVNSIIIDKRETSSVYSGLFGGIGVEWFIKKKFSLIAEYECTGAYTWNSTTFTNERLVENNSEYYQSEGTYTSWSYQMYGARMGLALYF